MGNNGYVKVKFSEYGKTYDYLIPSYIDINDIQHWVVVEDAYYRTNRDNPAPYKFCMVVGKGENASFSHATKYIVAAIDSKAYVAARDYEKIEDDIYYGINDIVDGGDTKDRVAMLTALALVGNDYCQKAANDFINENYNKIKRVMQIG